MKAVGKPEPWMGFDPGAGRNVALYIYSCAKCGRHHNSPDASVPPHWTMANAPGIGETIVHCPDCLPPPAQGKVREGPSLNQLAEETLIFTAMAEEIVNSAPAIKVYAAVEWGELNDDGKAWMAAIVREAYKRGTEATAKIGIPPTEARRSAWPDPFVLHLQKQEGGQYLIAMTPGKALMHLSPLEFFLSAEGARTLAWHLLRHADLADAPGTLPVNSGGIIA